ncbi:MAG: YdcH family protein [Alphaproteobacteria bacterium]
MSNTPHTLAEEFPGQMDRIHELKTTDRHFARLLREYDEVNDQIHVAETNVAPVEQLAEVELRKRRLQLKDAIAKALAG